MKTRYIAFNKATVCEMVHLDEVTVRRRIQWPNRALEDDGAYLFENDNGVMWPYSCYDGNQIPLRCPFGRPGDTVRVKQVIDSQWKVISIKTEALNDADNRWEWVVGLKKEKQ